MSSSLTFSNLSALGMAQQYGQPMPKMPNSYSNYSFVNSNDSSSGILLSSHNSNYNNNNTSRPITGNRMLSPTSSMGMSTRHPMFQQVQQVQQQQQQQPYYFPSNMNFINRNLLQNTSNVSLPTTSGANLYGLGQGLGQTNAFQSNSPATIALLYGLLRSQQHSSDGLK